MAKCCVVWNRSERENRQEFLSSDCSSQRVKKERKKERKNRCEKLSEKRWKPIDLHPSFAGSQIMTRLGLSETLSNWPYLTLVL